MKIDGNPEIGYSVNFEGHLIQLPTTTDFLLAKILLKLEEIRVNQIDIEEAILEKKTGIDEEM